MNAVETRTKIAFVYTFAGADDRYQNKLFSIGCKDMDKKELQRKVKAEGIKFKLYDDDGKHYFSGVYLDFNNPKNIDFQPLDQQMNNTGTTYMMYYEDGEWKQL